MTMAHLALLYLSYLLPDSQLQILDSSSVEHRDICSNTTTSVATN
jgi:hypothetical protein